MKASNNINTYHLHREKPTKRQFDLFDLNQYLEGNIKHSSKPHAHSFYQLIWFHSNEGQHFVDFNSFDIKRDRLFFIAKNQVHYFEKRNDYQGVLLHFNESFILQNEKDIDFFINYNLFNNLKMPYFQVPSALINELKIYLKQIRDEVKNSQSFGHESILSNTLKSFLITIEREKKKEIIKDNSSAHSISFLKFRNLLESGFRKNWSVTDYADKLNITTKTLNNLIKSKTGKTTSTLINERVILEAKRQLCHTDSFINEIAFHLGFQDPSYFVKFFKKQVKLTPSEFRKSIA